MFSMARNNSVLIIETMKSEGLRQLALKNKFIGPSSSVAGATMMTVEKSTYPGNILSKICDHR